MTPLKVAIISSITLFVWLFVIPLACVIFGIIREWLAEHRRLKANNLYGGRNVAGGLFVSTDDKVSHHQV
jgi:hypothetical protein